MPICSCCRRQRLEDTRLTIERVRAAAARHRRAETIRFSYPIRPKIKSAEVAGDGKAVCRGGA